MLLMLFLNRTAMSFTNFVAIRILKAKNLKESNSVSMASVYVDLSIKGTNSNQSAFFKS